MSNYYCWSGASGAATGIDWANAFTTLTNALSGKTGADVIFIAHDHVETATAPTIYGLGTPPNLSKVICVDRAGSVPPVDADRRTTAQVGISTGSSTITLAGGLHVDGIVFNGASTAPGNITLGLLTADMFRLDNCTLNLNSPGAGVLSFGAASQGNSSELNNTKINFGNAANQIFIHGHFWWKDTPTATSGAVPSILFHCPQGRGTNAEITGVDLSHIDSQLVGDFGSAQAVFKFSDCKMHASVVRAPTNSSGSMVVLNTRCGSSVQNFSLWHSNKFGAQEISTTVVRAGGASDNTTPISWAASTKAAAGWSKPYVLPPITIWNETVGLPVTATVECLGFSATATDAEAWLEVEYLGEAASMRGSFAHDGATILGTPVAQTVSSETWSGGGGLYPFKCQVTFTPQQKGWIYARVKIAKPSATFYIDPKVTLS